MKEQPKRMGQWGNSSEQKGNAIIPAEKKEWWKLMQGIISSSIDKNHENGQVRKYRKSGTHGLVQQKTSSGEQASGIRRRIMLATQAMEDSTNIMNRKMCTKHISISYAAMQRINPIRTCD